MKEMIDKLLTKSANESMMIQMDIGSNYRIL